MDAACEPEVREMDLDFTSQAAKTEILNSIFGFHVAIDLAPMLAVFPTGRIATKWSSSRCCASPFLPQVER